MPAALILNDNGDDGGGIDYGDGNDNGNGNASITAAITSTTVVFFS